MFTSRSSRDRSPPKRPKKSLKRLLRKMGCGASTLATHAPRLAHRRSLRKLRQEQKLRHVPSGLPQRALLDPFELVNGRGGGDDGGSGVSSRPAASDALLVDTAPLRVRDIHPEYQVVRTLGHGGTSSVQCVRMTDEELRELERQSDDLNDDAHARAAEHQSTIAATPAASTKPSRLAELVALKVIPHSSRGSGRLAEAVFSAEFQVLKRLKANPHPNVVEFMSAFHDPENDSFNIVTKMCAGGDLLNYIIQRGSFSEHAATVLVRQMLLALQHIHSLGIVHRDIKADNWVLVEGQVDDDEAAAHAHVNLVDFGVAMVLGDDDVADSRVGTLYYLAPEVLSSPAERRLCGVDTVEGWRASDMWSLGVTVYSMLVGHAPFLGDSNAAIFKGIRHKPCQFPSYAQLSEQCRDFVQRLLTKDWTKRMSASEALLHPWVLEGGAPKHEFKPSFLARLTDFRTHCRLSKAVARVLSNQLSDDDRSELEYLFEQFDTNKDGKLDALELQQMMEAIGNPSSNAEALVEAQGNGEGLDMDDVAELLTVSHVEQAGLKDKRNVFHMFDINGDGQVSREEILEICDFMSLGGADQLIQEIDKNGDGTISFGEWLTALSGFQDPQARAVRLASVTNDTLRLRKSRPA